jgi:hypothetical protein
MCCLGRGRERLVQLRKMTYLTNFLSIGCEVVCKKVLLMLSDLEITPPALLFVLEIVFQLPKLEALSTRSKLLLPEREK